MLAFKKYLIAKLINHDHFNETIMLLVQQLRKQTRLSRSTRHAHVDVRPPLHGLCENVIKNNNMQVGSFHQILRYFYLLEILDESSGLPAELFSFFIFFPLNHIRKFFCDRNSAPFAEDTNTVKNNQRD